MDEIGSLKSIYQKKESISIVPLISIELTSTKNNMSEISAKIICDSTNASGTRLTTIQIHIPKWLIQEINTHRVFSRSFTSSRAVPAKTLRRSADFKPDEWLSNQPGMVGGDELEGVKKLGAIAVWHSLTSVVKFGHWLLELCGLHKQYTNRWLEPIVWVDGVITSTDWDNFLRLRNHPAAQPEIKALASQIESLLATGEPTFLNESDWHLPYVDADDLCSYTIEDLRLISAGRCARVSYGFKDTKDSEGDLKRAKRLLSSDPKHLSPFEHIALVLFDRSGNLADFKSGNFRNWVQFRQVLDV
jgi:hypothetical protein